MNNIYAYYNSILCGKLQTVFINSAFAERFNLWKLRKRDSDHYTEERFREIDMVQEEMGIAKTAEMNGAQSFDIHIEGLPTFYSGFDMVFPY